MGPVAITVMAIFILSNGTEGSAIPDFSATILMASALPSIRCRKYCRVNIFSLVMYSMQLYQSFQ